MYRIFISHSWNYANQYNKILEFLDNGGVKFWGAIRILSVVNDAASVITNWNSDSVCKAVRMYAL